MTTLILQILVWTTVILSALLALAFYKSRGEWKLRLLMIQLFSTKVVLYGGFAVITGLLNRPYTGWWPILLNIPMCVVMMGLFWYVWHK